MHYICINVHISIPIVTEILETDEEGSSGSAEGSIFTDIFSQMIESNDTEIGQLFAYRHSNSSVTLATERNIGIHAVADGIYRCVAENDFEVAEIAISVEAVTSKLLNYGL